MERAELLTDFQAKVDDVVKFQGFIDKAQSQAERFTPKVVEKVVTDNSAKRNEVVEQILPLLEDIQQAVEGLEAEKAEIVGGQEASRTALEEMELRLMIEELSQEDFDEKAAGLQKEVASGNEKIAAIEAELESIQAEIGRWQDVADAAGVSNGIAAAPEEEEEEVIAAEEADEVVPPLEEESFDEDLFGGGEPEPDLSAFQSDRAEGEGVFTESVSIAEDVSVVFGDDDGDAEDEEEEGLSLEVGDMDTLVDDDLVEVGDADDVGDTGKSEDDDEGAERHAVMLYQEGTAEEQIYPFSNDVLTLGRGRDNDIQVKNDSKVSRYHCKLYRRNGNFYIEDNKSANGTLVNGELITERRLFGGEEIIIGETFFRFRIMD